jgi:quercetin dioxygenase-like cupin family protein
MIIYRNESQQSIEGPPEWFTGKVRVEFLFPEHTPSKTNGAHVTFSPGARTAWHTHPLGQTIIITSGLGLAQTEGEPIQELRPGDVVFFPPNEKHWHGASAKKAMSHIAIQENSDGSAVTWLEHVSDEQYNA